MLHKEMLYKKEKIDRFCVDTALQRWYRSCNTFSVKKKTKEVIYMNCAFLNTTTYGIAVIISAIILVLLLVILVDLKNSANCREQKLNSSFDTYRSSRTPFLMVG